MFFRNLRPFVLDDAWQYSAESLNAMLSRATFKPCGALDMRSMGWVPPRGIEGEFVVSVNRQHLIALGTETRLLPGSVVRQHVLQKLVELETQQGYKPGRGQAREVCEAVTAELMPRAFCRRTITYVWIDPVGRWLGVDSASTGKTDDVLEQLKRALDALPLLPVRTALSPSSAMTQWLSIGEAPAAFTIDRDCELRSPVEEKSTVRYTRHTLDGEDIRPHLEEGKRAVRLAMTFDDRLSFVLTEDLTIKKLAFLDILKEQAEQQAGEGADQFEADFAIMSGELARLLPKIVAALGGPQS